jgi:hypothetical protein
VLIDDHQRPVFSFAETPALHADIAMFDARAMVTAADFGKAGNILRKLIRAARFRRAELERRIISGADVLRQQPVVAGNGAGLH